MKLAPILLLLAWGGTSWTYPLHVMVTTTETLLAQEAIETPTPGFETPHSERQVMQSA